MKDFLTLFYLWAGISIVLIIPFAIYDFMKRKDKGLTPNKYKKRLPLPYALKYFLISLLPVVHFLSELLYQRTQNIILKNIVGFADLYILYLVFFGRKNKDYEPTLKNDETALDDKEYDK